MSQLHDRLQGLTAGLRRALAVVDSFGEHSGDDPVAVASHKELFTAALSELTSLPSNADDDAIRAAMVRSGRWIATSRNELGADARAWSN